MLGLSDLEPAPPDDRAAGVRGLLPPAAPRPGPGRVTAAAARSRHPTWIISGSGGMTARLASSTNITWWHRFSARTGERGQENSCRNRETSQSCLPQPQLGPRDKSITPTGPSAALAGPTQTAWQTAISQIPPNTEMPAPRGATITVSVELVRRQYCCRRARRAGLRDRPEYCLLAFYGGQERSGQGKGLSCRPCGICQWMARTSGWARAGGA